LTPAARARLRVKADETSWNKWKEVSME